MCSHTFSGVIWHCATEINSIQLHDSFVMVTLEIISLHLHYITSNSSTALSHCSKQLAGTDLVGQMPSGNLAFTYFRCMEWNATHPYYFNSHSIASRFRSWTVGRAASVTWSSRRKPEVAANLARAENAMGRGPSYGVRSDRTGQRADQPNQGAQEAAGRSGQFQYTFARLDYIIY